MRFVYDFDCCILAIRPGMFNSSQSATKKTAQYNMSNVGQVEFIGTPPKREPHIFMQMSIS